MTILTPANYARHHVPAPLLSQPERAELRRILPAMLRVPWRDKGPLEHGWRSVPVEAWVGFTTVASRATEDTARSKLPTGRFANERFHEVGLFQTPAGAASGPAPNPDTKQANNAWGHHAHNNYVIEMLGRPATMVPDGWMHSIPDQAAIGLADLRANMLGVSKGLGRAGVRDPSSTWSVALGFAGFGPGVSSVVNRWKPYAERLAQVPEVQRFGALGDLIDADFRAGLLPTRAMGSYLSAWSKLESGRLVAERLGHGNAYAQWYDAPRIDPQPWVDYFNHHAAQTSAADGLVKVLVVATLATLGYRALRARKKKRSKTQ